MIPETPTFAEVRVTAPSLRSRWPRGVAPVSSALMVAVLSLCYGGRFDACIQSPSSPPGSGSHRASSSRSSGCDGGAIAGSPWCPPPGSSTCSPSRRSRGACSRLATSPDSSWREKLGRGEALRVVTLNCDIGNLGAAAEVEDYHPDIILLKESPGREAVEEAGKAAIRSGGWGGRWGGCLLDRPGTRHHGGVAHKPAAVFVQARVHLVSGIESGSSMPLTRRRLPPRPLVARMLAGASGEPPAASGSTACHRPANRFDPRRRPGDPRRRLQR